MLAHLQRIHGFSPEIGVHIAVEKQGDARARCHQQLDAALAAAQLAQMGGGFLHLAIDRYAVRQRKVAFCRARIEDVAHLAPGADIDRRQRSACRQRACRGRRCFSHARRQAPSPVSVRWFPRISGRWPGRGR